MSEADLVVMPKTETATAAIFRRPNWLPLVLIAGDALIAGVAVILAYEYRYHLDSIPQVLKEPLAFGPYLAGIRDRLDYQQVHCPNSDLLCREQALWLEQSMFLGPREDIDDIYRAFEKVHDQRAALADWSRREGTR